jgi:hypothetical protein
LKPRRKRHGRIGKPGLFLTFQEFYHRFHGWTHGRTE